LTDEQVFIRLLKQISKGGILITTPIESPKIPRYLILVFLLLMVCIGTAGYLYYEDQKVHIKKERERELLAISDLKVNQIVAWRKNRQADAEVLFENYQLILQLRKWLKSREKSVVMEEILGWMSSFRGHHDYSSIFLLDEKGNVCLYTSEAHDEVGPYAKSFVNETIQSRKIIWTDLYRDEADHHIHLDILVPLLPREPDGLPLGVLLLRINPFQFLYSYIQTWPTPSRTAESLLVRREGIEVLFLNELRHQKNTALSLRLPIVGKQTVAVKAVQGVEGVVEEVDYRGVEVLAAVRKIQGSPWYLIAKVDQDEIYAPIREHAVLVIALVVVLILLGGGVVGFLWRNQAAQFYRKQYKNEIERQILLQRYEFLTKYANDIILPTDRHLKIIEANERALESYGFNRDEMIGLDVRNLRSPEERPLLEEQFKQLEEQKGLVIQTAHQRKDGRIFPVEASLRVIEVEGERFYQSIIRDITERKKAEEKIREERDKA
jgi:PAS domain S-box-containing protein